MKRNKKIITVGKTKLTIKSTVKKDKYLEDSR